jgi:acetyl-CoA carboxylase carboxyltransferase component
LVKAAIGETIDNKPLVELLHCEIGVTDYKAKDDKDALDKIKISLIRLGTTTQPVLAV